MLQFRKCFSSLIDSLFKLSCACLAEIEIGIHQLTRSVAQELVLLSAVAPLIFTNVAVEYLDEIYATDASNRKGAVVSASVGSELQESVWLNADKQGSYTHLDNGFRAMLRHLGEVDDDLDRACPFPEVEPIRKQPLLYFDFVEICGGAGKVSAALARLGRSVAPVLDLSNSRHYDLTCLRLTEWIIYMIEENRFRSFIAPPCTSFSPAAHAAVRSYKEPLGFSRLDPKTLLGNVLAFRTLLLLRVGRRCRRPCGAEQSRLSKMCWLDLWRALLDLGFEEAIIASCVFGSPHRKEFRLLCFLLDLNFLDRRCPGGHSHVRVQGSLTKPSAIYVDGLADHIGLAFHDALLCIDASDRLEASTDGLESVLANDVMLSSKWHLVRTWFWKKVAHINVLELASAVSSLGSVAQKKASVRFSTFLDSAVCRGALAKGRSASYALQPGLKRACVWCVCFDLYPAWPYTPTRLNTADDPTRDVDLREPVPLSITNFASSRALDSVALNLRRFAANWARLCLLVLLVQPASAAFVGASEQLSIAAWSLPWIFVFAFCSCLASVFGHWIFPEWVKRKTKYSYGAPKLYPFRRPVRVAMVLLLLLPSVSAMHMAPQTEVERQRCQKRDGILLAATRAIEKQTRDRRKVYLDWFRKWLWEERQLSFRFLIDQKPADAERISELLVEYGKALYRSGKAYGIFAETINSVAVERPIIRRGLTSAWDLAFAWLADEPHTHHPAMPLSLMAAMVVVSIYWGWPYEASVILMAWAGVMRVGEVLSAKRSDVVFPCDAAPGTSFMLISINQPKTRGRAARHQAARIDQSDVIRFLTAMYRDAPKDSALWPFSAATLRKRFVRLLSALQLPTSKTTSSRPFDLGSLRPGGATWMLHQTESPDYVRRRGRWLSNRTMEIYLQEVMVSTWIDKLQPKARQLIELCSGEFAVVIEHAISFLDTCIPPKTWFSLLKGAAEIPPENVEKDGSCGGRSKAKETTFWHWHDAFPSKMEKEQGRGS